MRSKGLGLAVAFLVASLAFAWWAFARRERTEAPTASVPELAQLATAPPPPAQIRPPGGYSIDARPNTILGRIDLGTRTEPGRGVHPELVLRHASGRRVHAPVTTDGFFGAGGLDDGTWTLRCETLEHWTQEHEVSLGAAQRKAEFALALEPLPLVEITLRYPVLPSRRPGTVLQHEDWLWASWLVVTRAEPGADAPRETLHVQPLDRLLPRGKDTVAGGERIRLLDGSLEIALEDDAWVAFVIGDRVVATRPVRRGDRVLQLELGAAELARGLGALQVQVFDAEGGAAPPGTWISFCPRPGGDRYCSEPIPGYPQAQLVPDDPALARLPCGVRPLLVGARDRGTRIVAVEIRPGETTRVAVRLEPERRVFGRVVDAEGRTLDAQLELAPLELVPDLEPGHGVRATKAHAGGGFRFEALTAESWVLRSATSEVAFAPLVLDTRAGDVADLVITAQPAVLVDVHKTAKTGLSPWLRYPGELELDLLRVRDERGLIVREVGRWRGEHVHRLALVPGTYRATLERGDGVVQERTFVAASPKTVVRFD
jgi:hypothetical protein